jgi:hypothetical protein
MAARRNCMFPGYAVFTLRALQKTLLNVPPSFGSREDGGQRGQALQTGQKPTHYLPHVDGLRADAILAVAT